MEGDESSDRAVDRQEHMKESVNKDAYEITSKLNANIRKIVEKKIRRRINLISKLCVWKEHAISRHEVAKSC